MTFVLLLMIGPFRYKQVGQDEYLIVVKASNKQAMSKVPRNWEMISQTKTEKRYRSPFVIDRMHAKQMCEEVSVVELGQYECPLS